MPIPTTGGRPHANIAHGYVYGVLKKAPDDGKAFIAELWKKLDEKVAGYPDHKPYIELSLMEDTDHHGNAKQQRAGKEVVLFVSFPNQLPPGHDVAHERIHDLAETINPNNNAAFGLSNHWCCYSDTGG